VVPTDQNRREALRVTVNLAATIQRNVDPRPTRVQIGNLSVTGCFIIGWSQPPGTKARIAIDLQDGAPPLELRIAVVREATWEGLPAAGARFEEPYPVVAENRLSKALRMLERQALRTQREEEP
jgi:hypothetical protein